MLLIYAKHNSFKNILGSFRIISILSLIVGYFYGCVEPYEPNISKYESLLVVDAILTDQNGSGHVTISKTYPYNQDQDTYVDEALVKLVDEYGVEYYFVNYKKGSYTIADSSFVAEIGEKYKIHIETSDGIVCESEYETITEHVSIDSIYYEFIYSEDDRKKGLQILIDVENQQNKANYFAWEYKETWETEAPFISPMVLNSNICYQSVKPAVFLIQSMKEFSQNRLMNYPLYFIDNTSNRLHIKYSVLVSQYILTESTYTYLKELKELNEEQGTLFDKVPLTLIGNLINLSDPDKPVLGNFQASAVSSKRIFLKNRDLPYRLEAPSGYEYCRSRSFSILDPEEVGRLDSLLQTNWVVMDTLIYINPVDTVVNIANARACFDCKANGTNIKPDYWDEE